MVRDYTLTQPILDTLKQALHQVLGDRAPRPGTVFRPETVDELAAAVGAADGFGGGITFGQPGANEIGLDLSGLDDIRSVDTLSNLITAEAGVTPTAIEAALRREGLTLGRAQFADPAAGLGESIANGEAAARVLSVGAVLPDGTVFETPMAPRRATGPDPLGLLVGAEGKMGIIAWVTLRAQPLPAADVGLMSWKGNALKLTDALRQLHRQGLRAPATLRKQARGQATLTLRATSKASAVLDAIGKQCAVDEAPPPVGTPRRLGWRRLLALTKGQGGRGLFIGDTDLHGGVARIPETSEFSDPALQKLARLVDPHGTLRPSGGVS
ncbi:MAG: FAD/FMN-containing dehydrogenase [Myxococcota bacterium]|jgi:FAD/FMN-containing dehydrogenase